MSSTVNFVPLPYRRVSVQKVDLNLTESEIRDHLSGKQVYFATDFIIFKNKMSQAAVVEVSKKERVSEQELFCDLISITWIAGPEDCVWVTDSKVDTGNRSSLAKCAFERKVSQTQILIVDGAFGHVNFISRPAPVLLEVIDQVPPASSRLFDLVEKALMLVDPGPIVPVPRFINLSEIAEQSAKTCVLFPCAASELKTSRETYFLDEHPPEKNWDLIGCERSEAIYRKFYNKSPQRIESCPSQLAGPSLTPSILRCCAWQTTFEVKNQRASVPWGADLQMVCSALLQLFPKNVPC